MGGLDIEKCMVFKHNGGLGLKKVIIAPTAESDLGFRLNDLNFYRIRVHTYTVHILRQNYNNESAKPSTWATMDSSQSRQGAHG